MLFRSKEIFPARESVLETDAQLYREISTRNSELLELIEPNTAGTSIA